MTRTPQNYFNRFPRFQPDPHLPLDQEFERLATHQGWDKKTKQYKTERNSFLIAQFHAHLGSLEQSTRLEDWQALCQELRVESIPESIMQCKKVRSCPICIPAGSAKSAEETLAGPFHESARQHRRSDRQSTPGHESEGLQDETRARIVYRSDEKVFSEGGGEEK